MQQHKIKSFNLENEVIEQLEELEKILKLNYSQIVERAVQNYYSSDDVLKAMEKYSQRLEQLKKMVKS